MPTLSVGPKGPAACPGYLGLHDLIIWLLTATWVFGVEMGLGASRGGEKPFLESCTHLSVSTFPPSRFFLINKGLGPTSFPSSQGRGALVSFSSGDQDSALCGCSSHPATHSHRHPTPGFQPAILKAEHPGCPQIALKRAGMGGRLEGAEERRKVWTDVSALPLP